MATGTTTWRAAMNKPDGELVLEGAKAYGLTETQIFYAVVRDGVVTIVTIGGHKCSWQRGANAKVAELHPLQKGESIRPLAPPKTK